MRQCIQTGDKTLILVFWYFSKDSPSHCEKLGRTSPRQVNDMIRISSFPAVSLRWSTVAGESPCVQLYSKDIVKENRFEVAKPSSKLRSMNPRPVGSVLRFQNVYLGRWIWRQTQSWESKRNPKFDISHSCIIVIRALQDMPKRLQH